jgi:Fe-S cluster assembly protein SufD
MAQMAPGKSNMADALSVELQMPLGRNWLEQLRRAGADRFASVGYPSARDEDWRLTNLNPIARTRFTAAPAEISDEARELAERASFGGDAIAELVFVNGHFAASLSRTGKLPRGATVGTIGQSLSSDGVLLERNLGRVAEISQNPFIAMNTGSFRDGAIVHIGRGVVVEGPIHVLLISTAGSEPAQSHPRILLFADDGAEATLVKSFAGGRGAHLTNVVSEIAAGNDCRINHNRLQMGGDEGFAIWSLSARLGRGSQLISHAATLGGKLTRNELNVTLAGEGADATLNGLVILSDQQHCDNHTLLDHAAAHCPSHELYKHVLDGKATCVFKGKILVRPGSQKTDSKQTSKSLLLSDDAQMNSQPALEIYADDVKCTHGSTIGPVDEEMVFYLRSRGVGLEAARHLLTYAFAADVTRRIKVEPVRRRLEDFLAARQGLPRDLRITDLGEHDEKAR